MGTRRSYLLVGSLAGLLLGAPLGCGQPSGVDPNNPEVAAPSSESPPPPPAKPLPISGGTLLILRDGKTAVAADPDRNVVWLADLDRMQQTGRIDLQSGDEPGRLVEDSDGKV